MSERLNSNPEDRNNAQFDLWEQEMNNVGGAVEALANAEGDILDLPEQEREAAFATFDTFAQGGEVDPEEKERRVLVRPLPPEITEQYGIPYDVTVCAAPATDIEPAISGFLATRFVSNEAKLPDEMGGGTMMMTGNEEKYVVLTQTEDMGITIEADGDGDLTPMGGGVVQIIDTGAPTLAETRSITAAVQYLNEQQQ